jgi:hypothetical protein
VFSATSNNISVLLVVKTGVPRENYQPVAEMIVCFVDIGGIVDHSCLEVIVSFVDIGGIIDHHCLDVIV